jgi:hypothetical protein
MFVTGQDPVTTSPINWSLYHSHFIQHYNNGTSIKIISSPTLVTHSQWRLSRMWKNPWGRASSSPFPCSSPSHSRYGSGLGHEGSSYSNRHWGIQPTPWKCRLRLRGQLSLALRKTELIYLDGSIKPPIWNGSNSRSRNGFHQHDCSTFW